MNNILKINYFFACKSPTIVSLFDNKLTAVVLLYFINYTVILRSHDGCLNKKLHNCTAPNRVSDWMTTESINCTQASV